MIDALKFAWETHRAPSMSSDELRHLQERRLRLLAQHACTNVPFYRKLFKSAGLSAGDLRTLEDLRLLPVSSRMDLQLAPIKDRLAKGVQAGSCKETRTSGSTGRPLTILLTGRDLRRRRLIELRSLRRVGFSRSDSLVALGPRSKGPRLHQKLLGLYRTEKINGRVPVGEQVRRLRKLKPDVLWVYPTVWRSLAEAGVRVRDHVQPHLAIVSAEVVDELLLNQIEDDLGIRPYNFYGCLELGRVAFECPARLGLHVNSDHVVLEICAEDGTPQPMGTPGQTVLTGLNAFGMPFLRYRLGDRASWVQKACSCGSPFPLIAPPMGRLQDFVRLPSGRQWAVWRFTFTVLYKRTSVLRYQIVQESADLLRFRLVTRRPWSAEKTRKLHEELVKILPEPMRIEIHFLESIPSDTVKFPVFVSRLEKPNAPHSVDPTPDAQ